MKCSTPDISWHNRDPVLSLDIHPLTNDEVYRLASGGTDSHVVIWHLKILPTGGTSIEAVSDLTRHQRAVNVVRWSPSGQYLASGDDDANIIIWHQKSDDLAVMLDGDNNDKEKWNVFKVLRGHKEDVYDICWSPDSTKLVSGSVDNTAIIWDLSKGLNENILRDHKGFVQGVAWDPLGQLIATLSSDRTCRVFSETGKQVRARVSKGTLPTPESHPLHGQVVRYYHDDTLKSFFRRLTFSPDGNLIITPAGYLDSEKIYSTYIYTIGSLTQPAAVLPSPGQYTIAVRCCPILFELWPDGPEPVISLPYRMVIAIATRSSIILYDTQQMKPFAVISNIHYTRLTDIVWSQDGRLLAACSTDGFCSLVTFEPNELGKEYVKEDEVAEEEVAEQPVEPCEEVMDTSLNVSVEEKKEKKPSFLEQWTKKTPKKVTNNKNSTESKEDNDVILVEPENEKENKNKNNVMATETLVQNEPKSDKAKSQFAASTFGSTPAKPIAVRRKPRTEQMNITQFLKSPKPTTSQDKKEDPEKPPPSLVSEDSVARDAWDSEQMQTDTVVTPSSDISQTNNLVINEIISIEDSQDIKLVIEDSTMLDAIEGKSEAEKMDLDDEDLGCSSLETNDNPKRTEENTPDVVEDVPKETNHVDNEISLKCDTKNTDTLSEPKSEHNDLATNSSETSAHLNKESLLQKKRIPLITLSSPKHKKKPF